MLFLYNTFCYQNYLMHESVRIRFSKNIKDYLVKNGFRQKSLPRLTDIYLKPTGISLKEFHPKDIVFRVRTNTLSSESKLELIIVTYSKGSYTHKNHILASGKLNIIKKILVNLKLEKYLEVRLDNILWEINKNLNILEENINGKLMFFKFEAKKKSDIGKFLKNFKKREIIKKNIVWILSEKQGLIRYTV